jgi:hypothetical protein
MELKTNEQMDDRTVLTVTEKNVVQYSCYLSKKKRKNSVRADVVRLTAVFSACI